MVQTCSLRVTVLLLITVISPMTRATRDQALYCGACLAMAEEMQWKVALTSPKQKIEVGGYRLDPTGKMKTKQIPLRESEVHLTDLADTICETMNTYAEKIDSKGHRTYIRSASRDGSIPISFKGVTFTMDVSKKLYYACHAILEEHDDEIIKAFQQNQPDMGKLACVDIAKVCTADDIERQLMSQAEAVMAGWQEKDNPNDDQELDLTEENLESLEKLASDIFAKKEL